jgi:UDP-glucose 4-epimerase
MNLTDQKLVVIGGAGFIGSHVVELLLQEPVREIVVFDNFVRGSKSNLASAQNDPRLRLVGGSITTPDLLADVLTDASGVIHLAALWLYECVHEPRAAIDVNIVGTFNVIEAAVRAGVKRLVYSSSASVYGDAVTTPMTEDHPFHNRTMYGATKIAGEQFLRTFHDQFGLDYVALRYMNVYGPRMDDRGAYVSVIMKVLDRLSQGLPPVIFGDGTQSYDFVHVSDVARANVLALKSEATDECINVGLGVKTTINELVQTLLALSGSSLTPEYRPQAQMFVTHRVGSTEKAQRILGFTGHISLVDGLRSVIEWRTSALAARS